MSEHRNGAAAVVETMAAHGVDTVFGIPGTHNLELYRHLRRAGLRHVTPRHEQGAGYAADAYARVTGRPAAVLTTSGPGLTNAMTAAATSYADSVPALYLSPGAPLGTEGADLGLLHETKDSSGAMGSLVASSTRVTSPEEAATATAAAVSALTRTGRRRPVHVEVPVDVLEAPWDGEPAPPTREPPRPPDGRSLAEAAEALHRARDVVVVAGGGSVDAAAALRALAELLDAPVVTTSAGRGVLDERHPLSVGAAVRLRATQQAAAAADVVLVVGSELGDSDLWGGRITATTVVRVDTEPEQLGKNVGDPVSLVRVLGDAAAVLPALIRQLADLRAGAVGDGRPPGRQRAAALRQACAAEAAVDAGPNAEIAAAVGAALPEGAVVTGDSSQVVYQGAMHFLQRHEPRRWCYMPGFATLGYALPAAVGAAVALPGHPAVALAGDGAFMVSVAEMMMAVELDLPVVVVVVDNGGYREIRDGMVARGIEPFAVDLARPDLPALARSLGADGERALDPDDLRRRLERVLEGGRPTLLALDVT